MNFSQPFNFKVSLITLKIVGPFSLVIFYLVKPDLVTDPIFFGFTPCYDCEARYQIQFGVDGNKKVKLLANGVPVATSSIDVGPILSTNDFKTFLVQVFPFAKGRIAIIIRTVDCAANPPTSTRLIARYIPSTIPGPFAVTYAVFGDKSSQNFASFQFKDGKSILKLSIYQITALSNYLYLF